MKKALALMLALVMVMLMVAACGGSGDTTTSPNVTTDGNTTTNGDATTDATNDTDATTNGTDATSATTQATTEEPKPTVPVQGVYYVPVDVDPTKIVSNYTSVSEDMLNAAFATVESAEAINIVDNSKVTLANVVTGHLYLVETLGDEVTVLTDLGNAMRFASVNRFDKPNKFKDTTLKTGIASGGYAYYFDDVVYLVNHIDVDAVNEAIADYSKTVGSFGKIEITNVTSDAITATVNGEEVNAADLNVRFVYMTYLGDALEEATEDFGLYTLKTNSVANFAVAEDETNPDGQGATLKFWQAYNTSGSMLVSTGTANADRRAAVASWNLYDANAALKKAKEGGDAAAITEAETRMEKAMSMYNEFLEYYVEQVNCNLWGDSIEDSAVYDYWTEATEALKEGETVTTLSYTYFYDVATDTYTIFVTDNGVGSLVYGEYLTYADFQAANPDLFN